MNQGIGPKTTQRRRMTGRGGDVYRVASPLELFFDLAFVVAIAFAAKVLHHDIVTHHFLDATLNFVTSFFAIWWAWMNYTWFASAYDTDDVPFRLLTMVQMCGVVVMAVGIADGGGFGTVQVVGYVIMRVALVLQWLRAAHEDEAHRMTCLRYAVGISAMQMYWIFAVLIVPQPLGMLAFAVGAIGELSVPLLSERHGATPWHSHHIAERYGLFVIIVLGEGVLGVTNALSSSIHVLGWTASLMVVAPASMAVLLGMWWAYFLAPYGERLEASTATPAAWAYGHVGIFASLAALGAGLEVAENAIEHPEKVSSLLAAMAITVPIAVFLVTQYVIHNVMWSRNRLYDSTIAVAMVLLVGIVGMGALNVPAPYLIAALATVPLVLVVPVELRARKTGPTRSV